MLLRASESKDAVERTTLADRAAALLRDQILLDKLKPDQILAERELSEKLGVSRTPLREALRILASEGLVEMKANLRPKVANPTLAQLIDLINVLASLERLAAELVVDTISEETIQKLGNVVTTMTTFPDQGSDLEFFRTDMAFHKTIVEATKNQPLITTHRQYNAALFRARFMSTKLAEFRPMMRQQHAEIFKFLKLRDGARAGQMLMEHIEQLKVNISGLYQDDAL